MSRHMWNCFACGGPVLGLDGQDDGLDTVFLESGHEAIAARAYGECHSLCLSRSRWGPIWAEVRLRRLKDHPLQDYRGLVGAYHVAKLRTTGEMTFLRPDGVQWSLSPRLAKKIEVAGTGGFLSIFERSNLKNDHRQEAIQKIQQRLEEAGRVSLVEVLEWFGVSNRLIFPEAIADGQLLWDSSGRTHWSPSAVCVQVRYSRFIPADILPIIDRLL